MPRIPVSWPYVDGQDRVAQDWLSHYAAAVRGRATCELLSTVGPPPEGREAT